MIRIFLVLCVFFANSNCQQQNFYGYASLDEYNLAQPQEPQIRVKRKDNDTDDIENWTPPPFCGETTLRVNMSVAKVYGIWYPIQASKIAYQLWATSLYGEDAGGNVMCPIWNIQPRKDGTEVVDDVLDIEVIHHRKTLIVLGALLSEGPVLEANKWTAIWPNEVDMFTTVIAVGTNNESNKDRYDWMVTVDCDLSGVVSSSSNWAVFSRQPKMSPEKLSDILSIANSVKVLQTTEVVKTGEAC